MDLKFEYSVLHKEERLLVYQESVLIVDKSYKDFSCLIDLVYNRNYIISEVFRDFMFCFLTSYVEYCKSGDFGLISNFLIIASNHKVYMGYIPKDHYIEMKFSTSDIEKLIYFMMLQLVNNEIHIGECPNCNKYFVKYHGAIVYCKRIINDKGQTCADIGAIKKYREKNKNNPIKSNYKRVYATVHVRIRYGKITKDIFDSFSTEISARKILCESNTITLDEFIEEINRLASLEIYGGSGVL